MRFARSYRFFLPACLVLASGFLVLAWKSAFVGRVAPPRETPAAVFTIARIDGNVSTVPREAVTLPAGENGPYVLRLERLRARKVEVAMAGSEVGALQVRSDSLRSGDHLLLNPGTIREGAAVSVSGGLSDLRVLELTLEAGIAAAEGENLAESARFISPHYRDQWGFDYGFMTGFLGRAFKEFDRPRVELARKPEIDIEAGSAVIRAGIRVRAAYGGRDNYLLGGPHDVNDVMLRMDKFDSGWKIAEISGLRPLGFEEKFMKLLGAEVGLPLSNPEKTRKKEACMPCRNAMAERFGGGG